jgi:cytochrome c-type biogenesis protein CcmH/NrfG
MGQYGDAAHLYETALRLDPGNAQTWFVLGNCLYRLGLGSGARIAWEQAIRAEPGHRAATENLALLDEQPAAA